MYVFVLTKANLITKEQSCKWSTVDANGADSIEMILAALGPFLLVYRFRTNGLSLKEKIHAEHCHYLKIFLSVLGKTYGRD